MTIQRTDKPGVALKESPTNWRHFPDQSETDSQACGRYVPQTVLVSLSSHINKLSVTDKDRKYSFFVFFLSNNYDYNYRMGC